MPRRFAPVAALLLVAVAGVAAADPVTIAADRRDASVVARITDASGTDVNTSNELAADVLAARATTSIGTSAGSADASVRSSFADPLRQFGSGSAAISWTHADGAGISAYAMYEVVFSVASPSRYAFDGVFGTSGIVANNGFGDGAARWDLLLGDGKYLREFVDGGNDLSAARQYSGTLAPGSYLLMVSTGAFESTLHEAGTGAAHGTFAFTFDVTPASPAPEPATLLLFGGGLGAAVISRVRRVRGEEGR